MDYDTNSNIPIVNLNNVLYQGVQTIYEHQAAVNIGNLYLSNGLSCLVSWEYDCLIMYIPSGLPEFSMMD